MLDWLKKINIPQKTYIGSTVCLLAILGAWRKAIAQDQAAYLFGTGIVFMGFGLGAKSGRIEAGVKETKAMATEAKDAANDAKAAAEIANLPDGPGFTP